MKEATTWIRVARCHDIPLREGRALKIGNREVAVFNLGDRFLAVENRCPHKAGPLADGIVSGAAVVCPLHAWKFSLETGQGVNSASASSCVKAFRTYVEDGVVLLELASEHDESGASEQDLPEMCAQSTGSATVADLPISG
jgi:nitrite reductase (NADH) small subunit